MPGSPEVADVTASALENLTLVKEAEKQQNAGPHAATSQEEAGSDQSPGEGTSDYQPKGRLIAPLSTFKLFILSHMHGRQTL